METTSSIEGSRSHGPPTQFHDRDTYKAALRAWEEATSGFCIALDAFMNPGARVVDRPSPTRSSAEVSGQALDQARAQRDIATVELDRVVATIRHA